MFKDKLKDLRTKKGVSQNDLAEKIFVSRSAIAKWENGLGMPSKASMDSLCNYFQISKEELLKEEDPLIIIDNIKRKSMKTLIIILAIILPILLYCLAFITAYFIEMYQDSISPQNGEYYSEKYLRKFDLDGLDMIAGEGYQLFGSGFTSNIDSYEVFEDYVVYVYNRLKYSTEITYLSVDRKIYDPKDKYADLFLIPSNNLNDHIDKIDIDGKGIEYEFYFFNESIKANKKEYINCKYMLLSYSNNVFRMVLDETEINKDSLQKIYLMNDYFEVNKIKLTNENYSQYLDCKIGKKNESIMFAPHGTYISGGMDKHNATPVPPFNLFIKVKFSVYKEDILISEIERNALLLYWMSITVHSEDFGLTDAELYNAHIELSFEILEDSYYYDIVKKER